MPPCHRGGGPQISYVLGAPVQQAAGVTWQPYRQPAFNLCSLPAEGGGGGGGGGEDDGGAGRSAVHRSLIVAARV